MQKVLIFKEKGNHAESHNIRNVNEIKFSLSFSPCPRIPQPILSFPTSKLSCRPITKSLFSFFSNYFFFRALYKTESFLITFFSVEKKKKQSRSRHKTRFVCTCVCVRVVIFSSLSLYFYLYLSTFTNRKKKKKI